MPARSRRPGSRGATTGRTTPKGTRSTGAAASSRPTGRPAIDRPAFGHDPRRGIHAGGFRPPANRSGPRGNR